MNNNSNIRTVDFGNVRAEATGLRPTGRGVDGGSGSGDDGGMDDGRITAIEKDVHGLKTDVAGVKDDVAGLKGDMKLVLSKLDALGNLKAHFWVGILAVFLTIVGFGFTVQQMTVSTFRAAAESLAQPPQPPIIINVPGQVQGAAQGGAQAGGTLQAPK